MATKTTKLQAVNRILSNIGQSPITTLESGNPLVNTAELVLDEINNAVQSEGWVFNVEYGYPFVPNTDGYIEVAQDVLALDSQPGSNNFTVIRNGKLYDKANHTFQWDGTQRLDVIWLYDFEQLPEVFRQYITIRAANVYAGRTVASKEAVQFGAKEEAYARAAVIEYDTQQGDYNIFQDHDGYTTLPTYTPVQPLYRK